MPRQSRFIARSRGSDIRIGSKGDFATELADVGFTPKNGHPETIVSCRFRANNRSKGLSRLSLNVAGGGKVSCGVTYWLNG